MTSLLLMFDLFLGFSSEKNDHRMNKESNTKMVTVYIIQFVTIQF